jgi:hypothetical protein
MKIKITKVIGYFSTAEIGEIHLMGAIDTTACGLANEDYHSITTNKELTCSTCKTMLGWAKRASKISK